MKKHTVVKSMKREPPSRERYDLKNPVVSIRVPEKVCRRLQETTKKTGMSYADVLKVGLHLAEVKVSPQEEVRRDAYDVLSISEMGHISNRTLWHDQVALTSSLRPLL